MTIYRLYMALLDIKPTIWRRIELSAKPRSSSFTLSCKS